MLQNFAICQFILCNKNELFINIIYLCLFVGNDTVNVEPFPSLLTKDIVPPHPSTYDFTTYKPSPDPSAFFTEALSDRKNLVNNFFLSAVDIPMPVSFTEIKILSSCL